jgi:2-polyprenyl-6-methoxyphenol hydroxylase-like FAD-dependent oxidoreductase
VATVDLPPDLVQTFWEIWGNRCRFGFMGIGGGQVYWFAAVASAPECYGAPEEVIEKLRRLAAVFPAPIPSLVAATASDAVVQTDLYDLVPLKQWHCGRVVLNGSAAPVDLLVGCIHPCMPMTACVAPVVYH